jgi:hypothetical protein
MWVKRKQPLKQCQQHTKDRENNRGLNIQRPNDDDQTDPDQGKYDAFPGNRFGGMDRLMRLITLLVLVVCLHLVVIPPTIGSTLSLS